ncbi:LamG-like jellyroll fold domain-containing protein [Paenibacillus xylanexedens]|uniref:LamG-like jellyroll fold domain-containing protein n=1 Tax=Paenibacillus xylanexedens TaxID=528191 RepID=UPI003D0174B3
MGYMTTQELMDLYGVSWFKMDEATANSLIDSKGSAIATITGTLSSVIGFDGQGKAKQFNGSSQYIRLGTRVLPLGKKSIRFKIKAPIGTTYRMLINNGDWGDGTKYGDCIYLDSSGQLHWVMVNGISSLANSFYFNSDIRVDDDKWHDILLTWDGTTGDGAVKMYIDDMYNPHKTTTSGGLQTTTQFYNLIIGTTPSNMGAYLFTGILDEIEIYNKDILLVPPPVSKILLSSGDKYYSAPAVKISDVNAIPIMTSNTAPSGVASASSINTTNFQPYLAFNQTNLTTNDAWISASGATNAWIEYRFPSPRAIARYKITCRSSGEGSAPKSWSFMASNDGVNWIVLDEKSNVTEWLASETREFIFINTQSYSHYRLHVKEVFTTGFVVIAKLEMYEFLGGYTLYDLPKTSESEFLKYGSDNIVPNEILDKLKSIKNSIATLGSGKIFEHTIDMSKRQLYKITLG